MVKPRVAARHPADKARRGSLLDTFDRGATQFSRNASPLACRGLLPRAAKDRNFSPIRLNSSFLQAPRRLRRHARMEPRSGSTRLGLIAAAFQSHIHAKTQKTGRLHACRPSASVPSMKPEPPGSGRSSSGLCARTHLDSHRSPVPAAPLASWASAEAAPHETAFGRGQQVGSDRQPCGSL